MFQLQELFSTFFFQPSWLAIVHQPEAPLAQRSPIGPWAGKS
jgi:hypothetical protein